MQVLLLATDEEHQLPVFRHTFPGPLLPIANRPVMAYTIEMLARTGVKHILVSLCHRGGAIASAFGNGRGWGVELEYLIQREPWGSAGSLIWALPRLNETTLVLSGNQLFDLDIQSAIEYHQQKRASATIILNAESIEGMTCDADGRILSYAPPPTTKPLIGAYVFEPHVLKGWPTQRPLDCATDLIPQLIERGLPVYRLVTEAYLNPLRSMIEVQQAQRVFLYGAYQKQHPDRVVYPEDLPRIRYPSVAGQEYGPGVWVGYRHNIDPGVAIAAPVAIGDNCHIGSEVELGPGVVVGPNVIVDNGATISNSTVFAATYVGQLANLTDRIVDGTTMADVSSGQVTEVVDGFLLDRVNLSRPRPGLRRFSSFIAGFILVVLTLPVMVLIGLGVLLTSGLRMFVVERYIGRRAVTRPNEGLAPEHLSLVKFRTRRDDGSDTMLGSWLRRWELDHLPSLWNVITGDLALVGIRPLRPAEADQLNESWHTKRYDSATGLTGLWFVQSSRDATLDEIVVADAYYAATRTWLVDVNILAQTPIAWFRRRNQPEVDTLVRFSDQSVTPDPMVSSDSRGM